MPFIVEWQGYEGALKQPSFSDEGKANNLKAYLESKGYKPTIKPIRQFQK